ncbi:MAG TPA: HPF/RaiA family ribosome-associated protein [Candidatus Acidoferrales bacterium]|nr:HPF/RaiA family ribosome-associated protein [Candidatus Acidoferrales bacterium]
MNVTVQYKCNEFRPQIEEDLARCGAKLERWLERYDSDLVSLHACYDKHPRKRSYAVTLNLNLAGVTLHASASHAEARFALRRAFDEIELQISKHQSRSRKDYEWKRKRLRRHAVAEA